MTINDYQTVANKKQLREDGLLLRAAIFVKIHQSIKKFRVYIGKINYYPIFCLMI
jgi:hypothetical protein